MPYYHTRGKMARLPFKTWRIRLLQQSRATRNFTILAGKPVSTSWNGYGSTLAASTKQAAPNSRRLSTPCSAGIRRQSSATPFWPMCHQTQPWTGVLGSPPVGGSPEAGLCRSSWHRSGWSSIPGNGRTSAPSRA
ncbi:hypothetical protein CGCS363_v000423 [Colletotrichum siamense]|uniref:uncharacterized protein n=1 Tax=Colletotrichum siamense TaxID=690259 RepID=UPI00187322F4|nr:uncharacterized protein CGCS363_v000423 [Colletotrichum siamense]KAF5515506.1 hypothetical protein CGCS363_v000423 [Colletotrichum siamense]